MAANLYARSIFGEDALANVSIEKPIHLGPEAPVTGHIRIRAKSQVRGFPSSLLLGQCAKHSSDLQVFYCLFSWCVTIKQAFVPGFPSFVHTAANRIVMFYVRLNKEQMCPGIAWCFSNQIARFSVTQQRNSMHAIAVHFL